MTKPVGRLSKTLRIAHKMNTPSFETDFSLEHEGDITGFFHSPDGASPPLDPKRAYNIVGPLSSFLKHNRGESLDLGGRRGRRGRRQTKPPEQQLKEKLQQIESSQAEEKKQAKIRLRNMSVGERILSQRHSKAMESFKETQRAWKTIERNLSRKLDKQIGDLVVSRANEYREKTEEYDRIDRLVSSNEKAGASVWYLNLRGDHAEMHFPVGGRFSGLYAIVKERRKSVEPVIRKQGTYRTTAKTFRDFDSFRDKTTETARDIDPNELQVIGLAKLPMEIEAVNSVGLEYLNTYLVPPPDTPQTYLQA